MFFFVFLVTLVKDTLLEHFVIRVFHHFNWNSWDRFISDLMHDAVLIHIAVSLGHGMPVGKLLLAMGCVDRKPDGYTPGKRVAH